MNYPTSVMVRAKELVEAGFCPTDACRVLERETGQRVSRFTIRRWTDAVVAEAKRADDRRRNAERRAAARDGRFGSARHTVILQETRVRSLADAGVPYLSIARVMAFDYPDGRWNDDRIAKLLGPSRQRNAARRAAA